MDLALNYLQRLICHKTQPTNQSHNSMYTLPLFNRIQQKMTSFTLMCVVFNEVLSADNKVIILGDFNPRINQDFGVGKGNAWEI